jgi:hypothetical protein
VPAIVAVAAEDWFQIWECLAYCLRRMGHLVARRLAINVAHVITSPPNTRLTGPRLTTVDFETRATRGSG